MKILKKATMTPLRCCLLSLGAVLLLSFYPLQMGLKILAAHFRDGYINAADYPKYVIPYTPIAIALILGTALVPFALKYGKRFALLIISALGVGIFLLAETGFERVMVFDTETVYETRIIESGTEMPDVASWQYFLCRGLTEEERQAIQEAEERQREPVTEVVEVEKVTMEDLAARYSSAFKVHFYLIAILIVLAVLSVVYGFTKMARTGNRDKRKPLILQAACVAVFIGLCVFACFTAFYRTGELHISAVSSWQMSLFFIVFGVTSGAWSGSLLFMRKPILSRVVPALIAAATTVAMYLGELVLLGGTLYRFGSGFLFGPVAACPLAPVDFAVIALSGGITYGLLFLIRYKENAHD